MAGAKQKFFPDDWLDSLLAAVAEGTTVIEWCNADPTRPRFRVVYEWFERDPAIRAKYVQASEVGTHAIAQEIMAETRQEPRTGANENVDTGWVSWQSHVARTRLSLLGKWNRRVYGDALNLDGKLDVGKLSDEELAAQIAALMRKADDA